MYAFLDLEKFSGKCYSCLQFSHKPTEAAVDRAGASSTGAENAELKTESYAAFNAKKAGDGAVC